MRSITTIARNPYEPDETFLYAFECCGLHKIGVSRNPFGRLDTIRQANPFPVNFVGYWRARTGEHFVLEKKIHRLLAAHRVRGEWFQVSLPAIRKAVRLASRITPWSGEDVDTLMQAIALDRPWAPSERERPDADFTPQLFDGRYRHGAPDLTAHPAAAS